MLRSLSIAALLAASGCGGSGASFSPIDPSAAIFWDRQTTETGQRLRTIADAFNAEAPGIPIKIEHAGGYGEIYRKVSASIQARQLPAMAVAYESMTAEYIPTGAVAPLDPLVNDPELGLSSEDLADFFPAVLDANRFAGHGGSLYSFPFTKSVLMLYFNKSVLRQTGSEAPPRTWDEFLAACRAVKARTGKPAYAVHVDCSTVSAMIFSMGGEIIRDGVTLYDAPEALRVFELFETLTREGLAYRIAPGTFDDEAAFAGGQVAFTLRTSAGLANMRIAMRDRMDDWGCTRLPQADPEVPATVLFGPNVVIFNTTEEQKRAAWGFVRHFVRADVMIPWAIATGYLPIRQSAAQDEAMRKYWAEWEYNREPFDCLAFARVEPNASGWQQVRGLVETALSAILSGVKSAQEAARDLKRDADAVLAQP